jgi:general secretion pathway protein E
LLPSILPTGAVIAFTAAMQSALPVAGFWLAESLSREYLLHHRVCPKAFASDGEVVVLAAAPDALIDSALDDVSFAYGGLTIRVDETSTSEVEGLIERLTARVARDIELSRADGADDDADSLTTDVRDLANQPPVVRYVNLLVRDAYDAGASDIHLEATRSGLVARFRLDGVLSPGLEPPTGHHHAVVSRVKLLAELDIAERRRPQDGRIRVRLESRELDVRVSTVPTMFGESVVLRLLDRGGRPVELSELGMSPETFAGVGRLAARPHGMVLVTGPTGSGKTTTLYACLQQRNAGAEKIISVEDPVEYQVSGVTQVPVHRQSGVTFAAALRSILRQDPDVVMVGEMRDGETAEVAVQAALTGHLVFSTLHTNDAAGAVPRLLDLGVPPYLVAATVQGIVAQRLLRRICSDCSVAYDADSALVAAVSGRSLGPMTLRRGVGCERCRGTGYRGRLGVFELLTVSGDVEDAIFRAAPREELWRRARSAGMRTLREDAWSKVEAGLTTVDEVARVVDV